MLEKFSYFSNETYVAGTQQNRLRETGGFSDWGLMSK